MNGVALAATCGAADLLHVVDNGMLSLVSGTKNFRRLIFPVHIPKILVHLKVLLHKYICGNMGG